MVKRQSWKSYGYLFFALMILVLSWEHSRTYAAVVETPIPAESIRLRILANSDSILDQALKRLVRDAIMERMSEWATAPVTIEEARDMVRARLPELSQLVGDVIRQAGFDYDYEVELGMVPFPAKKYGSKWYPAGEYEALRVTIGNGAGQNWWCVLFPPLCFVNLAKAEPADQGQDHEHGKGNAELQQHNEKQDQGKANDQVDLGEAKPVKTAKFRFFLWEKIKRWFF